MLFDLPRPLGRGLNELWISALAAIKLFLGLAEGTPKEKAPIYVCFVSPT